MNALGQQLLAVTKQFVGPAAPAFLSKELHAIGTDTNAVAPTHLDALARRARTVASRLMDETRAAEFGEAILRCASSDAVTHAGGDHRLASEAAAKLLAAGKIAQASVAYHELVEKHADASSYLGLARAYLAREDRDAALGALRDGAAARAKAGDRIGAVGLLVEAVRLAPTELATHRRLAAALQNQGDLIAACEEYGRYVDALLALGDTRRAWLELTYGREMLGDMPELLAIVDRVVSSSTPSSPPAPQRPAPRPMPTTTPPSSQPRRPVAAAIARTRPEASSAVVLNGASTLTQAQPTEVLEPVQDLRTRTAPAQVLWREAAPARDLEAELATLVPKGAAEEAARVAALRATLLIAARDRRATEATVDAVRRLLALKMSQAASDLLLDHIAAGFQDREAQRLLIEVDCNLGRRDIAKQKCRLLGQAYRLDGNARAAEDVERLAAIL